MSQDLPSVHLLHRQSSILAIRSDTFSTGEASKPKVWLSPQAAKDVPHVIFRFDATLELAVPVFDDALDNLDANIVYVVDGDREAVLLRIREVLEVGSVKRGAVKVGA